MKKEVKTEIKDEINVETQVKKENNETKLSRVPKRPAAKKIKKEAGSDDEKDTKPSVAAGPSNSDGSSSLSLNDIPEIPRPRRNAAASDAAVFVIDDAAHHNVVTLDDDDVRDDCIVCCERSCH